MLGTAQFRADRKGHRPATRFGEVIARNLSAVRRGLAVVETPRHQEPRERRFLLHLATRRGKRIFARLDLAFWKIPVAVRPKHEAPPLAVEAPKDHHSRREPGRHARSDSYSASTSRGDESGSKSSHLPSRHMPSARSMSRAPYCRSTSMARFSGAWCETLTATTIPARRGSAFFDSPASRSAFFPLLPSAPASAPV